MNISNTALDCDSMKTSNYATSSNDFICSITNQTSSNNGASSVSTGSTNASGTASSPSSSATGHHKSLSSGAKAGIGAGVGVGVPLIIGITVLYIIVRRRRRQSLNSAELSPDAGVTKRVEAPVTKSEMASELEAGAKSREPAELGTTVVVKSPMERQELAA